MSYPISGFLQSIFDVHCTVLQVQLFLNLSCFQNIMCALETEVYLRNYTWKKNFPEIMQPGPACLSLSLVQLRKQFLYQTEDLPMAGDMEIYTHGKRITWLDTGQEGMQGERKRLWLSFLGVLSIWGYYPGDCLLFFLKLTFSPLGEQEPYLC